MKKEIVIASYSEDTSWIPKSWAPQTLIYSCGNPVKKIEDRFVSEDYLREAKERHSFMPTVVDGHVTGLGHGHGHGFGRVASDPYLETIKLLELIKKMRNVLWDYEGKEDPKEEKKESDEEIYAHKKNENNKNTLESHQWLTHIIQRYDVLADVTVFLQGHPHDHILECRKIGDLNFPDGFSFCTLPNSEPRDFEIVSKYDYATLNLWNKILNKKFNNRVCWPVGAQFAASKEVIRSKPKEWYIRIKEIASTHECSAHALERTWWNVFGEPKVTNIDLK